MNAKQSQAIDRVLRKLSVLRITLSNEEREVLDNLIVTGSDEVEAHKLEAAKSPAKSPAKAPAKSPDADEVEAHKLEAAKTLSPDEKKYPRQTFAGQPRKIFYDAEKKTYRLED